MLSPTTGARAGPAPLALASFYERAGQALRRRRCFLLRRVRSRAPRMSHTGTLVGRAHGADTLEPVSLAYNLGFSARELRRIEEIVTQNRTLLREAWRGYFGT